MVRRHRPQRCVGIYRVRVTSRCSRVEGRCASAIAASLLLLVVAAEPVWLASRRLPRDGLEAPPSRFVMQGQVSGYCVLSEGHSRRCVTEGHFSTRVNTSTFPAAGKATSWTGGLSNVRTNIDHKASLAFSPPSVTFESGQQIRVKVTYWGLKTLQRKPSKRSHHPRPCVLSDT